MAQMNGPSKSNVSPAKHTESARMPNLTPGAEKVKRTLANFPNTMKSKGGIASVLGVAAIAVGGYYLFKKYRAGTLNFDFFKFGKTGRSASDLDVTGHMGMSKDMSSVAHKSKGSSAGMSSSAAI